MSEEQVRRTETAIEITASPEQVWKALTDAEELVRWFPLEARVEPGTGGRIWLSWGGDWAGESRIEIWEPLRRLRAVSRQEGPYDLDGGQTSGGPPVELAVDYHLQGKDGGTVLRLVNSGFGRGASWDDELEATRRGWAFELRSLRHYLERHRGRPRRVAWARTVTDLPEEEAWRRLTGPLGMAAEGRLHDLSPGDRYTVRTAAGDALEGEVYLSPPPGAFSGTVVGWNDALFRIGTDRGQGKTAIQVWLSTWDVDAERVEGFRNRSRELLDRLFPRA